MTPEAADPAHTAAPGSAEPSAAPGAAAPGPAAPVTGAPVAVARVLAAGESLLPDRSREDTDAAWGDHPESADDRLYRDRPPHWADF